MQKAGLAKLPCTRGRPVLYAWVLYMVGLAELGVRALVGDYLAVVGERAGGNKLHLTL